MKAGNSGIAYQGLPKEAEQLPKLVYAGRAA